MWFGILPSFPGPCWAHRSCWSDPVVLGFIHVSQGDGDELELTLADGRSWTSSQVEEYQISVMPFRAESGMAKPSPPEAPAPAGVWSHRPWATGLHRVITSVGDARDVWISANKYNWNIWGCHFVDDPLPPFNPGTLGVSRWFRYPDPPNDPESKP